MNDGPAKIKKKIEIATRLVDAAAAHAPLLHTAVSVLLHRVAKIATNDDDVIFDSYGGRNDPTPSDFPPNKSPTRWK